MFSSKTADHLAFVSRQLSNLLSDEQLERALQRLAEACPEEYARDIEYMRNLLGGSPEKGPARAPNPYATLAKLMPAVTGQKNRFFRNFADYAQQSKVVFETYWAGVVGMMRYLAALAAVAVILAIVFGASVVPSFKYLFDQFGAPLPKLTSAVFSFGGIGIPLFAVVVTVVVALIGWFVVKFHNRIQCLAPLPNWPKWMPIVGEVAETYNIGLFLNFTRILVESDVETSRAVTEAARAANQSPDLSLQSLESNESAPDQNAVLTKLGVAAKLGYLNEEIAFQCDQQIGRVSLALVNVRDRFSLLLKVVMYLFVATLVVAMYLPIFKLGSVI